MMIQTRQKQQASIASNTLDWPLILFFVLAFGLAWGIIPILHGIAQ